MAFLMHHLQLDCPAAFRMLKKLHRSAYPNKGFQHQLKLYGMMEAKVDRDNSEYRMFRLEHLVDEQACKGSAAETMLAIDCV